MLTNSNKSPIPPSPLQQGLLFNSMYAPDSGVDIVQVIGNLNEIIQQDYFIQAWKSVIERYAVMRTAFHWNDQIGFQQEIRQSTNLSVYIYDWSNLPLFDRQSHLENYLREDRKLGFDFSKPPLARLTLIRLSDELYYLIFTFHHVILDGRSLLILFKETFNLYETLCRGDGINTLNEIPFHDYLEWLQGWDSSEDESFWRKWFAGFNDTTPINTGKPLLYNSIENKDYGDQNIKLSSKLTLELRDFVQKHNLTMNTILQGAWSLLLSRYNRQDDVVFGVTRSLRRGTIDDSEEIVGLMINTLPMRIRLSPDESLIKWLKEIRLQSSSLQSHIHSDLMKVQTWSDISKDTPLFDHIVIFERYSLQSALRALGGKWEMREFELRRQPNYPLTVYGFDENELLFKIIYDRGYFGDETIKLMLGHLHTLLEEIVSKPSSQLRDLSLLTVKERSQILTEWNAPQIIYSNIHCIHDLFENQAKRRPDAIAVIFGDQSITYGELNNRANKLANYLRLQNVKPNDLIGICVEPSIEMIIGIIGILKAGGAYVPINPTYPKDRMMFMLNDAQVQILLTQEKLVDLISPCSAHIICLDAELNAISSQDGHNLAHINRLDDLAYVIYTSGSTGKPKGVRVTHHNVSSLFAATQDRFGFDENDVWTLFHSFAFDFSVWEIWGALLYGGQLIVVPFWISRSPEAFYNLLCQKQVTILNQTPSAFYQIIRVDNEYNGKETLKLRWIIFGGEKLEFQNLKPWLLRHGESNPQLVNMYGITETTVHVTFHPVVLADLDQSVTSIIGRPIKGWQVYLIDHYQQLAPIGVPGEMYVGGLGVTKGYLNRSELTSDKFIPNTFDDMDGGYLYKSGDLARYLSNGDIEYLGRIDQQVKMRGFRIELGEIEAILKEHSSVQNCAVSVYEDDTLDKLLIAYIVPQEMSPSSKDLREYLKTMLPDYMIPAMFILLDTLPLTLNGKLDRRALPEPEWSKENQNTFIAPRNIIENTLAEIWAEVLHINPVGVHDNFFDMGGHSLIATQLMARIRKSFKIELPLRILFDSPTIEGLAQAIDRELHSAKTLSGKDITIPKTTDESTLDYKRDINDFLNEFFDDGPK